MVFCRINSWLTGRRLVSLPFSDHCEPLCDSNEDANFLIRYLQAAMEHQGWKYLQVRLIDGDLQKTSEGIECRPAEEYFLHTLDLRPDLDDVFSKLDKDSVQRRVQRAGRACLTEKCGRSAELLRDFYTLFLITRRRQGVPPTPYAWFQNLIHDLDRALEIRVAYKDESPIAAIITLQFRDVVYYKYGCSDTRFNKFGAIPWLFWSAIASAKSKGAIEFDMGRTQQDNPGLLAFKNHWVPHPQRLIYWQYPYDDSNNLAGNWKRKLAKSALPFLPNGLQKIIGKVLYRHAG